MWHRPTLAGRCSCRHTNLYLAYDLYVTYRSRMYGLGCDRASLPRGLEGVEQRVVGLNELV